MVAVTGMRDVGEARGMREMREVRGVRETRWPERVNADAGGRDSVEVRKMAEGWVAQRRVGLAAASGSGRESWSGGRRREPGRCVSVSVSVSVCLSACVCSHARVIQCV